jgi:hypothetical protein
MKFDPRDPFNVASYLLFFGDDEPKRHDPPPRGCGCVALAILALLLLTIVTRALH